MTPAGATMRARFSRAWTVRTPDGRRKVRLAALDYEAGQKAEAHQRLDKILKKTPTGEAWTAKARFLASEHKLDEALKAAHAAVDFDRRIATAHYIIGSIELENGNYDEAEHEFREVLRLKKTTTAATLQLARTKLAAGKTADAVALAQSAGSALGARLTLARALIADGQIATARNELLQLEVESTKSADPSVAAGPLFVSVKTNTTRWKLSVDVSPPATEPVTARSAPCGFA
jgi:tetratricopeptide (TPR) repeat protein